MPKDIDKKKLPSPGVFTPAEADVKAKEGQTPVVPEFFHQGYNYNYNLATPDIVLQKSNELAATIWDNGNAMHRSRNRLRFSGFISENKDKVESNKGYYNSQQLMIFTVNFFNITTSNGYGGIVGVPDYCNININHAVKILIDKISLLEEKYDDEEILSLESRRSVIERVLVNNPSVTIFNSHEFGGVYINQDKNSLLSQEEQQLLQAILGYPNKIKGIGIYKTVSTGPNAIASVSEIIDFTGDNRYRFSHAGPELQKLFDKVDRMSEFLGGIIPADIQDTLVFSDSNAKRYRLSDFTDKVYRASDELRNVAIKYVQHKKPLSELLTAIANLAQALMHWQEAKCRNVKKYFKYFNRAGIDFKEVLAQSSEEYTKHYNEPPF